MNQRSSKSEPRSGFRLKAQRLTAQRSTLGNAQTKTLDSASAASFILLLFCILIATGCQTADQRWAAEQSATEQFKKEIIGTPQERINVAEIHARRVAESDRLQKVSDNDHQKKYLTEHPDLPADKKHLIQSGNIAIGFTMDEVKAALGTPDEATEWTSAYGHAETWHYGSKVLNFYNGVLTEYYRPK